MNVETEETDMRVKIEEGCANKDDGRFEQTCSLRACFPDGGDEYVRALVELKRTGTYQSGGGAAPVPAGGVTDCSKVSILAGFDGAAGA